MEAAVARVLALSRGGARADRWIAFRSHFAIESFDCRPGSEGAHEEGGAEGRIGFFRRNQFTPVPEVDSLAELNEPSTSGMFRTSRRSAPGGACPRAK